MSSQHQHGHSRSHGGHGDGEHGNSHSGIGQNHDQDIFEGEKAEIYDQYDAVVRGAEVELEFLKAQAWWPKAGDRGLVTLDFGCGTGRLLGGFGDALAHGSVAFDVSEGMLGVAKRRAKSLELDDKITFSKLDGDKNGAELAEFTGQIDLAMVVVVLHHTMEPKTVFEHLCGTVKPGGYLFVCELEKELPQSTLETWMEPFGLFITDSMDYEFKMGEAIHPVKLTIAERHSE